MQLWSLVQKKAVLTAILSNNLKYLKDIVNVIQCEHAILLPVFETRPRIGSKSNRENNFSFVNYVWGEVRIKNKPQLKANVSVQGKFWS